MKGAIGGEREVVLAGDAYAVDSKIAEGSFAEVFLVASAQSEEYALKWIIAQDKEQLIDARREIEVHENCGLPSISCSSWPLQRPSLQHDQPRKGLWMCCSSFHYPKSDPYFISLKAQSPGRKSLGRFRKQSLPAS